MVGDKLNDDRGRGQAGAGSSEPSARDGWGKGEDGDGIPQGVGGDGSARLKRPEISASRGYNMWLAGDGSEFIRWCGLLLNAETMEV